MLDRELFEFLDHTGDAAFAVSDGGEICAWNASAEALFGFAREAVIGRTCFDLLQGRGSLRTLVCTEHCHVRDCAAHQRPVPDFDLEVKTRAGRRTWVNVSTVVHVDRRTGRRLIVHLARDIGDRKRTEALVQRVLQLSREIAEAPHEPPRQAPIIPLSDQEQRVLQRFSQGLSAGDVERELRISPQTLRHHLYHINQKLGTHTRLEAVIHAIRRQLI
jgi:PAS domain S-box-containing protein